MLLFDPNLSEYSYLNTLTEKQRDFDNTLFPIQQHSLRSTPACKCPIMFNLVLVICLGIYCSIDCVWHSLSFIKNQNHVNVKEFVLLFYILKKTTETIKFESPTNCHSVPSTKTARPPMCRETKIVSTLLRDNSI